MVARRVLILGGTVEAVRLAERLHADPEFNAITSLAGRTRSPALLPGATRIGGFGGAEGLTRYLATDAIDVVIDATHPFASNISANVVKACRTAGLPWLRLERPPWHRQEGDRWIEVPDAAAAARALTGHARRVFLSIGRQDLTPFAELQDIWFLLRMIDSPAEPPPLAHYDVVFGRGPFADDDEIELLAEHDIDTMVSKNSGGDATYGKIAAARRLGMPVVMVSRPASPAGDVVGRVDAALRWLRGGSTPSRKRRHGGHSR